MKAIGNRHIFFTNRPSQGNYLQITIKYNILKLRMIEHVNGSVKQTLTRINLITRLLLNYVTKSGSFQKYFTVDQIQKTLRPISISKKAVYPQGK